MADEDPEEESPAVTLGDGPPVEGAPLSRVASRLSWPQSADSIQEKEGETPIRTANGPIALADILEDVETSYFATRREFVHDIRAVIGYGPVETAE